MTSLSLNKHDYSNGRQQFSKKLEKFSTSKSNVTYIAWRNLLLRGFFAAMKICSRVAHNIRDIRHYRGLSQEALAENADVSRGYMGKLENAKHSATLLKLERIAFALEIDPLILLLPRWHERDRLISFVDKQGGYIDLFKGRSA